MKVKCILESKRPEIFCVSPEETIFNCIKILNSRTIGAILILSLDEQILGIFTERDVLRIIRQNGGIETTCQIQEVMTPYKYMVTATSEDDITEVMALMNSRKIRHVPIVDNGEINGIITINEVVRSIYENMHEEIMQIRTDRKKVSISYLEQMVGEIAYELRAKDLKLGTAESCTGGLLAATITDLPGVSDIFRGSVISYSDAIKINTLGVKSETIEKYGSVSAETASEMALGVCKNLEIDAAMAVTGIAGPTGGTQEKPVGLVYIATAYKGNVEVTKNLLAGDRRDIRNQTVEKSLAQLLNMIKLS